MNKLFLIATFSLLSSLSLSAQNDTEAIIDLGYDKYLDEKYDEAISYFDKALKSDKNNAEIYFLRGVCYSALGEKKKAVGSLETAVALKSDYYEAHYEMGYIFLIDQNPQLAIAQFDKAISLNPDYAQAFVSRGTAKCMTEDKKGATKDWERAKALGVSYVELMVCD